jgi:hypothetical protein
LGLKVQYIGYGRVHLVEGYLARKLGRNRPNLNRHPQAIDAFGLGLEPITARDTGLKNLGVV